MDMYFDLHLHPLAKNHLALNPKKSADGGDVSLTGAIPMTKAFMDYTDASILRILESQCCIDFLDEGRVRLGVAAIAALEFGIASAKGYFDDIRKGNLKKPFDTQYFDMVREGKVSYLNLFLKEFGRYLELEERGNLDFFHGGNAHKLNENRLNLMFAIEGGHNLCMKKIGNALEYDEFTEFKNSDFFDPATLGNKGPADVLEHLTGSIRARGQEVLYLTLAHLTHIPEQHLTTHACGTTTLKHPAFYPFGNGLTDLGKSVIDRAYSLTRPQHEGADENASGESTDSNHQPEKEVPAPIFIDIAHMSLKSRQDFYAYRKERGYGKDLPIIASHVGVTGYSINDWKHSLKVSQCVNYVDQGIKTVKIYTEPKVAGSWGSNGATEFTFNPNTLNLMDEDIIAVVNSGGMIGIGLDVSLLGFESKAGEVYDACEYITTADFTHHFPYTGIQSLEYRTAAESMPARQGQDCRRTGVHPLCLCFNIVHVLAVIGLKTNKKNPEEYICLGSDFDGFIEPLRICSDSRQLADLEAGLLKWLPVAAREYQKENGGTEDLFELTKKKEKLEAAVRRMLYANGREFLGTHYPRTRSGRTEFEFPIAGS